MIPNQRWIYIATNMIYFQRPQFNTYDDNYSNLNIKHICLDLISWTNYVYKVCTMNI